MRPEIASSHIHFLAVVATKKAIVPTLADKAQKASFTNIPEVLELPGGCNRSVVALRAIKAERERCRRMSSGR